MTAAPFYDQMAAWRFANLVDVGATPDDCHLWVGACNQHGYGMFWYRGRMVRAHRWWWTVKNGPIPDGMVLRHRCDVAHCVNRNHLSLGTQADNMRDRTVRGRWPYRGDRHRDAKLNPETIREAADLRRQGWYYKDLAERFGVSTQTMHTALTHRRGVWADVDTGEVPSRVKPHRG